MSFPLLLAALIASSSLVASVAGAQGRCGAVFADDQRIEDPLLGADLLRVQAHEVHGRSAVEVAAMNRAVFDALAATPEPGGFSGRLTGISPEMASKVISSMGRHPVLQAASAGRYNQRETQIGYCFGRAAYAHLALLEMGIDRGSIRKIWAVGSMKSPSVTWQFHVSTIVRGSDGKWYAVDNYFGGRALEIEKWFDGLRPMNRAGDLRVYITDPSKFSVSLGTYDQVQLGLRLSKEQDWYKGYFQDMLNWFRTRPLEDVGLTRLIPEK